MGVGGYATNGWNYGVFGRLQGSKYGAGVYGTSNPTDNGTYVDGKYAGYFNGNTKVVGDLTVTGTVKGLVLGQAATVSSQQRSVNSVEETICDKLSLLSAVGYYKEVPVRSVNVMVGDTLVEEQAPTLIEMQDLSKKHYALSAESVEAVYPDLVYEAEDGTKSINYIELVPLLVQAINELQTQIEVLKGTSNNAVAARHGESTSVYGTSVDGLGNDCKLFQNSPNPFRESSVIKVKLPDSYKSASLHVFDMSGKQLKQIDVTGYGETSVTLSAGMLGSGMYLYSLVIDGKVVDTKRMIVTD